MDSSRRLQVLRSHLAADNLPHHSSLGRQPCSVTEISQLTGLLLKGQVAVITGSGQGLGAAAAELFALHGAQIVVSDLDAQKAEQVAERIRSNGGDAHAISGDVTADDFPERLVTGTIKKFGKIDILVNNAGFTWDGVIHRISKKQWASILDVHVTAPFRIIQAVAPYMREAAKKEIEATDKAQPRTIINVSSTVGMHGNIGQANYSAAKAAIIGLTKTVAKEWGPFNVRCNAVAYGFIDTRLTQGKEAGRSIEVGGQKVSLGIPGGEMAAAAAAEMTIPMKRIGTPAEAAGAMLALASPLCAFVTGQALEVTGGANM